MTSLRVVHWYPNCFRGGAVASATVALANAQAELGADVVLVAVEEGAKPLYGPLRLSRHVRTLTWRPAWTLGAAGLVLRGVPNHAVREIHALRPTVVHVHGEFNPDNLRVPGLFRCPIVLSPHGAFHPLVLAKSRRWSKSLYVRIASRILYRHATLFHAASPMERDHIARTLPGAGLECIPQGPGESAGTTGSHGTNDREAHDCVRYVFVGRLDVFTKGLDILIDAYDHVARELGRDRVLLTLTGPDWRSGRKELEGRAAALRLTDRIRFTGALSGAEVSDLLRTSDVYVQLSRHEGAPLSIAEALLAGKPTIVSDTVGTTTFPQIRGLPHVRVVAPSVSAGSDAMIDFARRLPELERDADRVQADVQEFFSWSRIARLHLDSYARIQTAAR